ncbi:MAG: hypothetical protein GXY36_03015 [Chloroflexi bacterium]|nr:hypothetical protein [Chloroflexota bacterium]
MSEQTPPRCLVCEQDSRRVPLIQFVYQDGTYWICPQHLPILIHRPAQLAGKLPGAENLGEAEHH